MMSGHIHTSPRGDRIVMFPQTRNSLHLSEEIQSTLSIKVGIYCQHKLL